MAQNNVGPQKEVAFNEFYTEVRKYMLSAFQVVCKDKQINSKD